MPSLRKVKHSNFTVIDNCVFKDYRLSAKAKGILTQMLSLPDGWNYSISGLTTLFSDGESSIRSGLDELKAFGYLKINRLIDSKGKVVDWEYIIFEDPSMNSENPVVENPHVDNPVVGNQGQLNTNESSMYVSNTYQYIYTDKEGKERDKEKCRTCNSYSMNDTRANDDEVSISKSSSELSVPNSKKSTKFIPPTQEEVIDYCNQKSLSVDPYYFYSYYTEADWHDAKGRPVKNWKQRMITWNANAKAKEYSRSKASETSDTNKSEESDERFKKALDDYPWCKTVDDFHVVTEYGNTFYIPKFTEDGKRVNEAGLIMED